MLNLLFCFCSKNDQVNKIKSFVLIIFTEMNDKKKVE